MLAMLNRLALALAVGGIAVAEPVGAEDPRPGVSGGVYDKPYIAKGGRGTILGGYIDHELFWNDKKKTFDQHRFIPFIHGEVSERIHVTAEIEFEHGGLVKGSGASDGELKLEFATLDITFAEWLTFRAGVVLSPLGKFNLIHDSPLNDLTNRPLVARQIVPTTLSEAGMGFFGTFYPSEASVMGYELYVVNGFNEGLARADGTARVRSGRGSQKADNNEEKSMVGRVNYSPFLGLDIGGSFHAGAYDDAGDESLTILAVDAIYTHGPVDLLGEYATASIDGTADGSQSGLYGQVGYHFLPGAVTAFPNSIFTAVARYDHVDLDSSDETRYTFGVNFRPEEETVIKLDYEIYDQDDDSNGLILSVASYF
jgi:hypothetical protein